MPRIMIVDDDRTMVSLLSTLFELDGYEVVTAQRLDSFVEEVRSSRPDLILMDVFLKRHDGIELVKSVRAQPDLAQLPVVMTSGMDVSDQCLAAGATAFVLKPYEPERLAETISQHI